MAQISEINQYLKTAYVDPKINLYNEEISFLSDNSFRTPIIREIDLRLRTNDLNPAIEDYRLRVDLTNPFVSRADKQYQQAYLNYQSIRSDLAINEVLQDRYLNLIRHYWLAVSVDISLQHKTSIQKLIESGSLLTTRELISIDKDLLEIELDVQELNASMRQIMLEMGLDDTLSWDNLELISLDQIKSIIDENLLTGMQEQAALSAEKQLQEADFQVEKSNSRRNLAFIQPEYENDPGKELSNRVGMQVGINIPITNGDKADLGYEKLKLLKAQSEIDSESVKLQLLVDILKNEAENQIESISIVDQKLLELSDLKRSLPLDDWKAVYDFIEYETLVKKKRLKLYTDLMDSYIQSLSISGRLAAPPKTNYLVNSLPTFD